MITQSSQHTQRHKGITLPITTEFRQIAEKFAQQCLFAEKATQIRLNTLAVCAVNAYLQLMDVVTQVEESDSWNPMLQMMADVADLKVPNVGAFSCRAIAANDDTCYIPPEDWHNRAGYIAVVIDEAAAQATLLGFMPAVDVMGDAVNIETEQVSLDRFAAIETLIEQVHGLQASAEASRAMTPEFAEVAKSTVTQLGLWTKGLVESGWQAIDALVNPTEMTVAFRTNDTAHDIDSRGMIHGELDERGLNSSMVTNLSRAKLVDLGLQLDNSLQVALVIHLAKVSREFSQEKLYDSFGKPCDRSDIILQVRPLGSSPYLPEGVCLSIFDENDHLFRNATSRSIDNYIQLQITGESGETFSVQISKGEATFREHFAI
jgi:hypothetical protein